MGIIVTIAIIAILACLAAAGYFLIRGGGAGDSPINAAQVRNKRMAKALAWRVALSITLFSGIMLAWALGWIAPHGAL